MTDAAVAHSPLGVEPAEAPLTPESWGKLGMWTFLAADAMSFGGLLAAYGALRYFDPAWPLPSSILGINLTAVMTFLLICSSVTMVEALAGIRGGDVAKLQRFLAATVLGGTIFLSLQSYEWTELLVHEGQSVARDNFGATFFILTGFHGCHVFSGVVYLAAILGRSVAGVRGAIVTAVLAAVATVLVVWVTSVTESRFVAFAASSASAGVVFASTRAWGAGHGVYSADNNNEVEIGALYWHFVDLIWILVFTFVYLM